MKRKGEDTRNWSRIIERRMPRSKFISFYLGSDVGPVLFKAEVASVKTRFLRDVKISPTRMLYVLFKLSMNRANCFNGHTFFKLYQTFQTPQIAGHFAMATSPCLPISLHIISALRVIACINRCVNFV